jgi:hypothetical protein
MGSRVDARDVLDPDAKTARAFSGRIVGHFRPTGPNAWDDYEFVMQDEGTIEVLPGLKIQLERHGARFRMRRQGRVIRVEWEPDEADRGRVGSSDIKALRAFFLASYVVSFDEAPGHGLGAVVARKLED